MRESPAPQAWRQPAGTDAADAATRHNLLLSGALSAVRIGEFDEAQRLIDGADGLPLTLSQVFRLYQAELQAQAEQLRDSQQRTQQTLDWFSHLFHTLPVSALLVDRQGLIVQANALALDELGLTHALRRMPVPLRRLMASVDGELRLAKLLPQVRAGHTEGMDDIALRTLTGQSRWADLRVSLAPPRESDLDGPMYLCVLNDRTDWVEAQRAREAASAAEYQRDMALSANRAKSDLLSRVSHELRTPLNAVIGFSHLLLMSPDAMDDKSRRYVQHIGDAGEHLLALVDEVLQINSGEAGRLAPARQSVDLGTVLQQVMEMQQPSTARLGVQMTMEPALDADGCPPSKPLLALADPRRVREVLGNLVSNGIKYNRPGGWLKLRLGQDAKRVWVQVHDSGIGMSPQQLVHLFEPFNRLGAERLNVPGHGLGLSIARTLAHAMNGTLEVASVPGEGSRFMLYLPRWDVPAAGADPLPAG